MTASTLNNILMFLVKVLMLYCVVMIFLFNACFCLYEDQVGLFDWRKQFIGKTKEVYFEEISQSKRAFISTEANVLAALNVRTGQLMWRKIFDRKNGNIDSLFHNENTLLTISGKQRKKIRSWEKNKGDLLWESSFSEKFLSEDLSNSKEKWFYNELEMILPKHHSILLSKENGGLLIAFFKKVVMVSQNDGSEVWNFHFNSDQKNVFIVGIASIENENRVILISVKRIDNEITFIIFNHLNLETGKLLNEVTIKPPQSFDFRASCVLLSNKYLVCLNTKTRVILVKNFVDLRETTFTTIKLSSFIVNENEISEINRIYRLVRDNGNRYFGISLNYKKNILATVDENKNIIVLRYLSQPGIFVKSETLNQKYIFEISKSNNYVNIDAYDVSNFEKSIHILKSKTNVGVDHGAIMAANIYTYSKKNDLNFRMLISFEDHTLFLIQNIKNNEAKILWSHEEALSTVSSLEMIELPPSTLPTRLELLHDEFALTGKGQILTMFLKRIKSQMRQFQVFTDSLRKHQKYGDHHSDFGEEANSALVTRDQFNIVKMIVAFTDGRKIYAINSQNGEIVWSKFLSSIHPSHFESKVYLFEQRSTAHFPYPPQCLLVAPFNNINNGEKEIQTVIYTFDPLTGEGLDIPFQNEDYQILHAALLPYEDDKSVRLVSIIDTNLLLHIYPDTKAAHLKLYQHLDAIYIYLINTTQNTLKGYKIKKDSNRLKLFEVWRIHIPNDQKVISLKSKRSDEVVNSVGRVLGDQTVLYKYLNPNLLALIAHDGIGVKGSLFVYIVDAVTGNIVHQAKHKGVSDESVDAILAEHWLVYIYYNLRGRRYEVSVAEFYEGFEEKNNTAFSSLDPLGLPLVLSQSYLLPLTGISSITSTCTEHGITSKNILVGLDSGRVYSISKNFLDPRRRFQQTQMLQEEGLSPYVPELPLIPQGYINYNRTIYNIKGIHTSPAGLESTSLVLIYGLDLFFTRVTPSRMFDVLKEDFDYVFISVVLAALILVSIISSKFSSMRRLKLAWQ